MTFTSEQIAAFVGGYMWPFMRIGAMLMAAPFFGARSIVPGRVRLALAIALTWTVVPLLPPAPAVDPLGGQGILISAHQILLGVAMGLILQLAFSALVVGGQAVAMSMGLGFAQFIDPTNGLTVPVVAKFYTLIGTLLFLALNGHLVAIRILVESFDGMPVGPVGLSRESMLALALWGGRMFVGGVLIALPALVTIKLINIGFGVMMRASPQLNIFAVGFPTTMAAGFVIIMVSLPNLLPRFTDLLMDAFDLMQAMLAGP